MYSVNIDAEQGKVVVVGDGVDPAKLIKKLNRSGKHAEMWGSQRGMSVNNQNYPINNQLQNLQVVDNNSSKVGGKDNKSQNHHKVPPKVHKSVKFNLQQEEEFDASDDGYGEFDDNFDDHYDEEEEEEGHGHGHNKIVPPVMGNGGGPRGPVGVINGPAMNAHKGGHVGNYGRGKKGEAIDPAILQMMKGKGGNQNEAKNGNEGGRQNGGDHQRDKNNNGEKQKGYNNNGKKSAKKSDGGLLGRFLGYGRKSKKGGAVADTYQNKNNYNWGKEEKKSEGKSEGNGDGNNKSKNMNDFDFHDPLNGKNGKGSNRNGNEKMGPKVDNNGAVQGVPTMNGGGGGYPQGMQMQPTLEQQQYMAMMMNQQQQQQANMNNMYPQAAPMMYDRPQSSMNNMYPPPPMPSHPMADPITHTFSDENVESCSIM